MPASAISSSPATLRPVWVGTPPATSTGRRGSRSRRSWATAEPASPIPISERTHEHSVHRPPARPSTEALCGQGRQDITTEHCPAYPYVHRFLPATRRADRAPPGPRIFRATRATPPFAGDAQRLPPRDLPAVAPARSQWRTTTAPQPHGLECYCRLDILRRSPMPMECDAKGRKVLRTRTRSGRLVTLEQPASRIETNRSHPRKRSKPPSTRQPQPPRLPYAGTVRSYSTRTDGSIITSRARGCSACGTPTGLRYKPRGRFA